MDFVRIQSVVGDQNDPQKQVLYRSAALLTDRDDLPIGHLVSDSGVRGKHDCDARNYSLAVSLDDRNLRFYSRPSTRSNLR